MKKHEFARILLVLRYSRAGHWVNDTIRSHAPHVWRLLRDDALAGHQPQRTAARTSLIRDKLAHRNKKSDLLVRDREQWEKAFRKALKS